MILRRSLLIGLLAFAAGLAGVFVGRLAAGLPDASETGLHPLLHRKLDLSAAQKRKIDPIEARFAIRRAALDLEMRAANARLAEAIGTERGYGPRVTGTIDDAHRVMGEHQKETLRHFFAMRGVLGPDQLAAFDRSLARALTADAR
ncbi:MAG: periplasmic heavy metal sensor [Sphingopyxis sp.]|nr:periplasmic heavy metal sensor [Sphingopyxis sp.]